MSSPEPDWDEEREDYASLADEASCPDAQPWNDDDWEPSAVENAKRYAAKHDLGWPPDLNAYDRWYDWANNEGRGIA